MQRFYVEGADVIAWRQAGDAFVPTTLAPRDNHRRFVSDEMNVRFQAAPTEGAPSGFNPAWARNANTLIQGA